MGWPTLIKCKTNLNKTEKYIKDKSRIQTRNEKKSVKTHLTLTYLHVNTGE